MKAISDQLRDAREKAGLNKTELARRLGWASHSNVVRIEEGRNIETDDLTRWAEACGCEVLIAPTGSPESVGARLHDAEERELRLAAGLLDLLRESRSEPQLLEYFETDLATWRRRLLARRAVDTAG